MLTVLESIRLSTKYLEDKGVSEARLNAELLLAEVLQMKRLELYLSYEKPLSEKEKTLYREYLRRRGEREPLQYIVGHAEFYGESFLVNRKVLIPRPETEQLVEKIVKENLSPELIKIMDIGTGSGNIPIILKKEIPTADITGVDISNEALEIARENCKIILNDEVINFVQGDIFDENFTESFSDFNIIVSNPPYVSGEEFNSLEDEVKLFEPEIAVTDKANGLTFYERIADVATKALKNNGKLYLEVGHNESEEVKEILADKGFARIEVVQDYAGIDRIIKAERV